MKELGWEIAFVARSKEIYKDPGKDAIDAIRNWRRHCRGLDLVFSAIPDGAADLEYIVGLREMGIPIVISGKGAMANNFAQLKSMLGRIGYSATVGGGTGMINLLRQRSFSRINEVHVILNGTLNYAFCDFAMGNPVGHVMEETKLLRYAEPGQDDPIKILLAEAGSDVPMKVAILFNLCFDSPTILCAKDIEVTIDGEGVRRAISEATDRRFVVSFYRRRDYIFNSSNITAFCHIVDDWVISARFSRLTNPLVARLCKATDWVNNGILTVEGRDGVDGVYLVGVGPGAGPSPTTAAMIHDAENF